MLFLFWFGAALLVPVGQGGLFSPVLAELVVDPVPELIREVLLLYPAAVVVGVLVPDARPSLLAPP